MRLILNFLEFNFESVIRIPSWFVQDILDDFIRLASNFKVFINLILLEYKWFERLFRKTQFRRHMIDFKHFDEFTNLMKNILIGEENGLDNVTDLKHKTLIIVSALEIATTATCFDQFDSEEILHWLKTAVESKCETIKLAAQKSFITLVNKDKIRIFAGFPGLDKLIEENQAVFTPIRKRHSELRKIERSGSEENNDEFDEKIKLNFRKNSVRVYNPMHKKSECEHIYLDKNAGGQAVKNHVFKLARLCWDGFGENYRVIC